MRRSEREREIEREMGGGKREGKREDGRWTERGEREREREGGRWSEERERQERRTREFNERFYAKLKHLSVLINIVSVVKHMINMNLQLLPLTFTREQ